MHLQQHTTAGAIFDQKINNVSSSPLQWNERTPVSIAGMIFHPSMLNPPKIYNYHRYPQSLPPPLNGTPKAPANPESPNIQIRWR